MSLKIVATNEPDPVALIDAMGRSARAAARVLAYAPTAAKNVALLRAAGLLRDNTDKLLAANALDIKAARERGLDAAMLDRLELTASRVEAMAKGLDDITALPDPVGETIAAWDRPNGLKISRVRVPIGVIGVIYESRPNVTADAGALCLKSGNAVILRGGSESQHSSRTITELMRQALTEGNLPVDAIQLVPTTDRAAVGALLAATKWLDLIVPRGGRSLIDRVSNDSRVPVLKHYEGLCHVYVDRDADQTMATEIVANAKMRRTGVCGSAETLLIDKQVLASHLPGIIEKLIALGCELRGDAAVQKLDARIKPASEQDWRTEYLAPILSIAAVDGVDAAIAHIERYGSQHTESIVTDNAKTAQHFLQRVDSAIVMHNASTQFADGAEFGLGAEIGISTNRLHARGPVGLAELTIYKNIVQGTGQIRP
ncbi:MAG: glutamate-5-semialdehyde dehydrogenase [Rhodospirillales bacterium]